MFTKFLDILPDPNIKIGAAGNQDEAGTAGQGFASVKLSRNLDTDVSRAISGTMVRAWQSMPKWEVTLNYNPLTKAQFDPIYSFLLEKQNGLKSFYVILPTYKLPKNSDFAAYVQSNTIATSSTVNAGVTRILVQDGGSGLPMFGDLFHIEDPNNTLHTKTYMVHGVETNTDYLVGAQPAVGTMRVHFTPGLQKSTAAGSLIVFNNPLMKVRQIGDVNEYALDNDNLYLYSLKLEEVTE